MRKKLLFIHFILFSNFILGQDFCATSTNRPIANNTSLSRMLYGNSSNEETLCLNVYFHIVREDNGSGGIPSYETNLIVDNLNYSFSPYNITFNKAGHDYIDNSYLNNIEYPQQQFDLILINNVPNAINFYIVDNALFGMGRNIG